VRCGLVSPGIVAQDAAQRAVSSHKLVKAVVFCLIFMAVEVAKKNHCIQLMKRMNSFLNRSPQGKSLEIPTRILV
jgi:hypothetical protein